MAAYANRLWRVRVLSKHSPILRFVIRRKIHIHRNVPRLNILSLNSKCGISSASNNDSETPHENKQDTHEQSTSDDGDSKPESEASVRHDILNAALDFVPGCGWSDKALSEGARTLGYPGVAHGMFPRGGGDLVHHFVEECNLNLADKLAQDAEDAEIEAKREGGRARKTTPFIRDALEARLRMITPLVDQWPQAMALTAIPSNTGDHFKNLMHLIDDIWYHAGDRSSDFNWYTKRISLAAVYKSAELCLVQDKSTDFQDTWVFIDRRLADFGTVFKSSSQMKQAVSDVSSMMTAVLTVGRNMAGLNDPHR